MPGIVAYGAYVPYFRLSRAEIARAWTGGPTPGERAVAAYDEDSLTMAVEAARDCLRGREVHAVDGLYFASTTAPYKEKQSAATIAAVLGLPESAHTVDFSGSLRAGTNALTAALDAVAAGRVRTVLVVASDMRLGYPSGPAEVNLGDGAAALLVGADEVLAEVIRLDSRYYEIQDVWRSDRDLFVRSAEDRFAMEAGYLKVMVESVSLALRSAGLGVEDIARVALNSPNPRQLRSLCQKLRFDEKSQVADVLHPAVGDTGCAMSLMSLVAQLEEAGADEMVLLASYGNGCDVVLFKTTDRIRTCRASRGMRGHINSKALMHNYEQYLRWRELLELQPPARPPLEIRTPSPAAQWREVPWELRLTGTKCRVCGTPQYPPQRVCVTCQSKDQMEPYRFTDVPAKVFSFSHDYVMQTIDPPVTVAFVDFEGGGRLMCDMTDRDPAAVVVGMPVEMTFRRLYYVNGIYNYWWKCRPVRAASSGGEG